MVNGDSSVLASNGKLSTDFEPIKAYFLLIFRKEVFLCVYFKVRQSVNTAPVVGIAVITYRYAFLLSLAAAMYVRSVISAFATTAPTMENVRKYGERWWIYEADEL